MIKIENTSVVGWEAAIRGMRNPMNSWDKSDSRFSCEDCEGCYYEPQNNTIEFEGDVIHWCNHTGLSLGSNDIGLMKHLRNAGMDHRKFMRMIIVTFDLTAPLYWWKEFDTYKVGTVANSCSTMHKIHAKEFTLDDFSHEHLMDSGLCLLENTIESMNFWRLRFIEQTHPETKKVGYMPAKECWWQMIQLLPTSYNQKRTILLNYEVLANIYKSRRNHKLDEWHDLCHWIETLPYSELITGKGDGID